MKDRDWDEKTRKLADCLEALLELDRERAQAQAQARLAPPSAFHSPASGVIAAPLQRE